MKRPAKRIIAVTALLSILLCFVQQVVNADVLYEDTETGVSFIVPGGWEEAPLQNKDPLYMKVKYVHYNSEDSIIFGAADMWSDEFEDDGFTRSDFNNDVFTIDEWADIIGMEDYERYDVTFNGIKYYVFEFYTEAYGTIVTNYYYTYINNAVMYQFLYSSLNSNQIDDFFIMLDSVEYPDTSNDTAPFVSTASSKQSSDQSSESPLTRIFAAGLVGAISGPILALIYILKNKLFGTDKAENSAGPGDDADASEPTPDRDAVIRPKKRKFALKRYSKDDPDVPMRYFKFYLYVRLPLTVINYLVNLYTDGTGTGILSVLPFLEALAAVCIIIGLAKKEYWGYVVNKIFIIIEIIFSFKIIITGLSLLYYGDYASCSYSVSYGVSSMIWNIPTFIYFEKRKYLFNGAASSTPPTASLSVDPKLNSDAPDANNEPHQMTFSDYDQ